MYKKGAPNRTGAPITKKGMRMYIRGTALMPIEYHIFEGFFKKNKNFSKKLLTLYHASDNIKVSQGNTHKGGREMTVRELRSILVDVYDQDMTIRELRKRLFELDEQDEEMTVKQLVLLTRD